MQQTAHDIPEVALGQVERAIKEQLALQRQVLDSVLESREASAAERSQEWGSMGQLYLLYDLLEPAEFCLQRALDEHPGFRWYYLLGSVYRLNGRLDEATAAYSQALESRPNDAAAQMRLGELRMRQRDTDGAQQLFDAARSMPGYGSAATFGLGRIAVERANYKAAITLFEAVLRNQPDATEVYYHLGLAHRGLGDRGGTRRAMERIGDGKVSYPDPIALELQQEATGVGAWLSLGRLSVASGDLGIAEQRFRKAAEIDPTNSAGFRALGNVLLRQDRPGEAIESYETALRLEPDDAGLRFHVAQQLLARLQGGAAGVPDSGPRVSLAGRAIRHLESAVETAPDFLGAWVELARAHEVAGDLQAAERALDEALALEPAAYELVVLRAALLRQTGRENDALDLLLHLPEQGLETPLAYSVAKELIDLGAAEPGAAPQHVARVRRYLESVAAGPNDAQQGAVVGDSAIASFHLGNLHAGQNNQDQAIVSYRRALELAPSMVDARFNLATLLGRGGRYREAASHLDQVVGQRADHHQARFGAALALVLAGEYAQAIAALERALALYPLQVPFRDLLAQVLVAAPAEAVRDGARGLEIALALFETDPTPDHAATVAMAFAEQGDFEQAAFWQQGALDRWRLVGAGEAAVAVAERRLRGYQDGRAVRSPWNG